MHQVLVSATTQSKGEVMRTITRLLGRIMLGPVVLGLAALGVFALPGSALASTGARG